MSNNVNINGATDRTSIECNQASNIICSNVIRYSYGADKKTADWRDCGNGVKDVEFNPASRER